MDEYSLKTKIWLENIESIMHTNPSMVSERIIVNLV